MNYMSHIPSNIHCPHKFITNLMGNYIPNLLGAKFTEFSYFIIKTHETFRVNKSKEIQWDGIGFIITVYKNELPGKYHDGYHNIKDSEGVQVIIDTYEHCDYTNSNRTPSNLFNHLYVYLTFREYPLIYRYMKLKNATTLRNIQQYNLITKKSTPYNMF